MIMPDLSTSYLGFALRPGSVGLATGRTLDNLRRMEDAGAAAVVLPSLFEEQIEHESHELLMASSAWRQAMSPAGLGEQ